MSFEKLIRGDKVAVIISPNFGSGWATWNVEHTEALMFDKDIAILVLDGKEEEAKALAETKYEGVYTGSQNLTVVWVEIGKPFEIEEYDGSESVHIIGDRTYYVA